MNAQKAWQQLSEVPVNADGETEAQFLGFPIGTEREAIWAWLEDEYDVRVYDLMYQSYPQVKTTNEHDSFVVEPEAEGDA